MAQHSVSHSCHFAKIFVDPSIKGTVIIAVTKLHSSRPHARTHTHTHRAHRITDVSSALPALLRSKFSAVCTRLGSAVRDATLYYVAVTLKHAVLCGYKFCRQRSHEANCRVMSRQTHTHTHTHTLRKLCVLNVPSDAAFMKGALSGGDL
jgi:hypothetical protein